MTLREARPEDALAVARVHVRSWQTAYRGVIPDAYLDNLKAEDRAGRYTFGCCDPGAPLTIVATEENDVLGFVTIGSSRDEDPSQAGEIFALYVDPSRLGSGLGRSLMSEAKNRLYGQGFDNAVLWVLLENERALRFYRADGWIPNHAVRDREVWGVMISETRYRRRLP
ncbi:MAG: GNAT family N-acetyltransferase [Candidatus Eremiobacteraeota bacterium]|nr:GNAT family N-acetyltransferase [Candidatus Eremiobacteraeota bacterium]